MVIDIYVLQAKLRTQSGIFMPLVAAVAIGFLSLLFLLAGFTGRVKLAQSEIRAKIDLACGDVAKQVTYSDKINSFAKQVNYFLDSESLRYAEVLEANLVIPTMPQSDDFGFYADGTYSEPVGAGDVRIISGCGSTDGVCKVYREVIDDSAKYPPGFWDNIRNAGHTLSCEFKVRVKNDFLSPFFLSLLQEEDSEIVLKSMWWSPVRGPSPVYNAVNPISTSPGLTIAIGTQMYTSAMDKRFRFKDTSEYENYNPLKKAFPVSAAGKFNFFQEDQLSFTLPPSYASGNPVFSAATEIPATPRLPPGVWNFPLDKSSWKKQEASGLPPFVSSALDEYLTACMNPAILVRNTFLSTIVELAARHGQLRNMTEILHMNPMHRHPDFYPSDERKPNLPVKLVSFGEDLAKSSFQLPYVFYHSGNPGSEYPNPLLSGKTYQKSGWINPFQSASASGWSPQSNVDVAKEHSLIAGQLRYCHSLYTPGALKRYEERLSFLHQGSNFQPGVYEEGWGDVRQRPHTSSANPQFWDQKCQYQGLTDCSPEDGAKEPLTAGELVSILGSTQMCPYRYEDPRLCHDTVSANYAGHSSADSYYYELKPDIYGTLRYIFGQDLAIKSPGIFPLTQNTTAPRPFSSSRYEIAQNLNSSVLLLFHESPLVDAEGDGSQPSIADIQDMVEYMLLSGADAGLPTKIRPITVVYMPTTYEGSLRFNDVQDAFSKLLSEDIFDEAIYFENSREKLLAPVLTFNVSPYDAEWGPRCGGPGEPDSDDPDAGTVAVDGTWTKGTVSKKQDEIFRDYWHCLLTDEGSHIASLALNLFSERILNRQLKF